MNEDARRSQGVTGLERGLRRGTAAVSGPLLAFLLLLATASALAAGGGELLERFDLESYDVGRVLAAAESGRPFVLRAGKREFMVVLEEVRLRAEAFKARAMGPGGPRRIYPPRARTFKGRVQGDPASLVRLSFLPEGITAVIKSARGWTYIDPVPVQVQGMAKAGLEVTHRVYTESDLDANFSGVCRQELVGRAELIPAPQVAPAGSAPAGMPVLEVAAEADYEFFQTHGDGASTRIESILNTVAGIFEVELGITVELSSLTVWETESDPYTTSDPLDLLVEFRSWWNANRDGVGRDVAHLFTGRNLVDAQTGQNTVGIAYVGVVCDLDNAYSLSQDLNSMALLPLLVAHELGHNLGALHDDVNGPRYIMYPTLSSANLDEFSDASETAIFSYLDRVSCVEPQTSEPESPAAPTGSGGGGGGGGPVDPLAALAIAAAELLRRALRGGPGGKKS